jgi:hypothetical protein
MAAIPSNGVNYHGKKFYSIGSWWSFRYWIRVTGVKSFTVKDPANEKVITLNNPGGPFVSLSLF